MQTALFLSMDTPGKMQPQVEVRAMNSLLCSLNVVALVTLATLHFVGDGNGQREQLSIQSQPQVTQHSPRLAIQTAPSTSRAVLANDSQMTTPETTQRWVF